MDQEKGRWGGGDEGEDEHRSNKVTAQADTKVPRAGTQSGGNSVSRLELGLFLGRTKEYSKAQPLSHQRKKLFKLELFLSLAIYINLKCSAYYIQYSFQTHTNSQTRTSVISLHRAASAVASWDRQIETSCSECSLASMWQTVDVINGVIAGRSKKTATADNRHARWERRVLQHTHSHTHTQLSEIHASWQISALRVWLVSVLTNYDSVGELEME